MSSTLRTYLRRMWRAALTPQSLLTLEEAVEALPCPGPEARSWLQEHVEPAGEVAGVEVYLWSDVLAALHIEDEDVPGLSTESEEGSPSAAVFAWLSTEEAAERLGIARCTLDEMVAMAPVSLPGAPVQVGTGKRRQHLRWDAARLDEWLMDFHQWKNQKGRARIRTNRTEAWGTSLTGRSSSAKSKSAKRRKQSLLSMVTTELEQEGA